MPPWYHDAPPHARENNNNNGHRKQQLKRFNFLRNKEKTRRKNVLTYFLINRKYKKNKRLRTVRLKKVH
jgi:hypothetical protein